jgi:hypothetical protein
MESSQASDTAGELERPYPITEIYGTALSLYRRYSLLFVVLAFAVIAPYQLALLAATGHGALAREHGGALTQWLIIAVEGGLVTPLVSALHMHAVACVDEGRRPRLLPVAREGLAVLPVVSAATLAAAVGFYLGFIVVFVPGILLYLRWVVVPQTASVEEVSWREALTRSRQLTRGHYRHVAGVAVTFVLPGLALLIAARAIPLGASSTLASMAVGIALHTAIASFSALTLAILYFDLCARESQAGATQVVPDQDPASQRITWQTAVSLAVGIGFVVLITLRRHHFASSHTSGRVIAAVVGAAVIAAIVRGALFIAEAVSD